ncbi:MAG: DUF1189 family protein [Candidatus Paceibacterota bacterium]
MSFFSQIKNSIYNRDFYKSLLGKSFTYSFKYYFKLALIFSLLGAMVFGLLMVPNILSFLWTADAELVKIYPPDLVVTITDGQVSVNQPEPYSILWPEGFKLEDNLPPDWEVYENLVVIDTTRAVEATLNSTSTLVAVSGAVVGYKDLDGKIYTDTIAPFTNTEISYEKTLLVLEQIRPWYKFLIPFFVAGFFMVVFLMMVVLLGLLLIQALFSWVLLVLMKVSGSGTKKVSYIQAFQITLHATTLPVFLMGVLSVFGYPLLGVWFLALILVIIYLNLCPCLDTDRVAK